MAKIKIVTTKDKEFILTLAHCGRMNREQAEGIGMNSTRLHNFKKDGYIERTYSFDRSKRDYVESFYLTNKGRSFATAELGVESFYRSNGKNHDIRLAEYYLSLDKSVRQSWLSQSEIRKMLETLLEVNKEIKQYQDMKIKSTNGGYRNHDGSLVLIEVSSRNQKPGDDESLREVARRLDAELVIL